MVCQTSNFSLLIFREVLVTLKEKHSYIQHHLAETLQPQEWQAPESFSSKKLNTPSFYFAVCRSFGGTSQTVFAQRVHQLKSTLLNQPSNRSKRRCAGASVTLLLQRDILLHHILSSFQLNTILKSLCPLWQRLLIKAEYACIQTLHQHTYTFTLTHTHLPPVLL